jgi:hypothetical protein
VVTTLLLAGSTALVHRAVAEPPLALAAREPKAHVAPLCEAQFKELKAKLDVKNQPWASIHWKYSLTEARQLAAETRKPIFMVVNTGNVLGCV